MIKTPYHNMGFRKTDEMIGDKMVTMLDVFGDEKIIKLINLAVGHMNWRLEMSFWKTLDNLEKIFVIWAFVFQIVLIIHFAIRKPFFESYTKKYGWFVYALCIPAVIISVILIRGGKDWTFWAAGFIFIIYAMFGFWVDYVAKINFRNPFQPLIGIPYVILYLATIMFYWWPLWPISRLLWSIYTVLYVVAMVLNIRSH